MLPRAYKGEKLKGEIKYRAKDFKVEEVFEKKVCKAFFFKDGPKIYEKTPIDIKQEKGKYLHLTLEKFNLDLYIAIKKISSWLKISKKRISFAGIKDKRAWTAQRISIYSPDVERLKDFHNWRIYLSNPEWREKGIKIGDLDGNYFTITIRGIKKSKEEIEFILNDFAKFTKKGKIPNYFGVQRFGGIRGISHIIGRELIKKNFKIATFLYLSYIDEREKEEIKNARLFFSKTLDFREALKKFPKDCRYELAILNHLVKHPNDFVGAWRKLPKHLRYLFTHAYQSYLFNKLLGRLLLKKGVSFLEGKKLPILGFETKLEDDLISQELKKIMDEEGITKEDFFVESYREISSSGAERDALIEVKDFEVLSVEKDEILEGYKATIKFYLQKGSYATSVLREFIENPVLEPPS